MKELKFDLDEYQLAAMTSSFREKVDVIRFWMKATQLVINYVSPFPGNEIGSMRIKIDKMSRLFVESENKSFSVSYPFMIRTGPSGIAIYSHSCDSIDSEITSAILSLIDGDSLLAKNDLLAFTDQVFSILQDHPKIQCLLRDLLVADDGYLRVDHDVEREDGKRHPLNHLDIFYSSSASFKLGLSKKTDILALADILDIRTDCHFLHK